MSTYLEITSTKFLELLTKANDAHKSDEQVINGLKEIENVLQKVKDIDLLNRVDIFLKPKVAKKTDRTDTSHEVGDMQKDSVKEVKDILLKSKSMHKTQHGEDDTEARLEFSGLLTQAMVASESNKLTTQQLTEIEKVLQQIKDVDFLNKVDMVLKPRAEAALKTKQTDNGVIRLEDMVKKHVKDLDMLNKPKHLGQTLVYQVSYLERLLDNISSDSEVIKKMLDPVQQTVKDIDHLVNLVHQVQLSEQELSVTHKMSQERSTLGVEDEFNDNEFMFIIRRSYGDLDGTDLKVCLLSFSIFPENSVIKKRPLIYWWIGEGFITSTKEKRAEERGQEIFAKLMSRDLIQPDTGESSCELLVKNCTMHPWIRRMLISLAREASLFDFESKWPMLPSYSMPACRRACLVSDNKEPIPRGAGLENLLTVFNIDVQYLNFGQEWLSKLKRVEVLQLGRWQKSGTHHIEVEHQRILGSQAESLNGLGATQKYLKYLSLRGISRITELPDSILNLISLEILDLRACHDLERLPSDISSLKKLTHLDVSECYLLEGMPKGIQKLSFLQVLKGFLIGSPKKTPCKLGDLAKLKKLRRLSIHMGNEAVVQAGDLKKLEAISSLCRLKISWGVVSENLKENIVKESKELLFPANLEKLDLQGIPLKNVPDGLRPSKLKKLKKLYIMGGALDSLKSLDHGNNDSEQWKVEILRLNFLQHLPPTERVEWTRLKQVFPCLQYWTVNPKIETVNP